MDDTQASLFFPQLRKIEKNWAKRREIYNKDVQGLKNITGITYPKIAENSKSAFHLFTVWVNKKKRNDILQKLGKSSIGVAVNYRAIHLLKYF